jgi:hypothetical protein
VRGPTERGRVLRTADSTREKKEDECAEREHHHAANTYVTVTPTSVKIELAWESDVTTFFSKVALIEH